MISSIKIEVEVLSLALSFDLRLRLLFLKYCFYSFSSLVVSLPRERIWRVRPLRMETYLLSTKIFLSAILLGFSKRRYLGLLLHNRFLFDDLYNILTPILKRELLDTLIQVWRIISIGVEPRRLSHRPMTTTIMLFILLY